MRWQVIRTSKKPIQIFIFNRIVVDMGASFEDTQRTRYMRYHYVREGVENNQHSLIWITTNAQVADIGTKILGRTLLDSLYLSNSLSRSENSGGVLRYTCSSGIY
jgi:hypothetical protein